MKYVYPAVFHPEAEGGYCITFPDIGRGATQSDTVAEGIGQAEDFLSLALYNLEEEGAAIPPASTVNDIRVSGDDFATLIAADTEDYRRYVDTRLVKKTLNIPAWLNRRAEDGRVNFSQTLQRALKEELGIRE